jgi:hypothetical protein
MLDREAGQPDYSAYAAVPLPTANHDMPALSVQSRAAGGISSHHFRIEGELSDW